MLRVTIQIGTTTFRLSNEPLDYDGYFWEPRISNSFDLTRVFEFAERSGNRIRSLDLSLDNRDGYFNEDQDNFGFLNMKVSFFFNEGDKKYKRFTGRVNKINSYGDDISLTIMEMGYEYLKDNFPDAQIAYDYYSTSGINNTWNAIPLAFGTVNKIPLAWVNLFRSEFIIASGPLYKINKLYFDKVVVYDHELGINGYKPSPEIPEIKFRIFHGAGSEEFPETVDGFVSEYPGFAYVQLYTIDDDGDERGIEPVNPDGEVVQIYADIEGIQNDDNSGAERNPAKILYNIFTKPISGYSGYGLGLQEEELDFDDAIFECETQGFKLDGAIDSIADFETWLNEILRCCRGIFKEEEGKLKLFIDSAKAPSVIVFDEEGIRGNNCIIGDWNEPDLESQTNRVKLFYDWNFERNDFNRRPGVHEESPHNDPNLADNAHANRILKWNTETLEFKLLKDDKTAHKLAQYMLKSVSMQLKTLSMTTEVNIGDIDAGDVIKVNSRKFNWVDKEFRITTIKRSETQTILELKEYSSDIYNFIEVPYDVEIGEQPYSSYNIPDKPVFENISIDTTVLFDGTTQTLVNIDFTKPDKNVQMVAVYYKKAMDNEDQFKMLDFTVSDKNISIPWVSDEIGEFHFRLVSISNTGIYSDIAISHGDQHYNGHPGEEIAVEVVSSILPPGTPVIFDASPVLGGVSIYIAFPEGTPSNFSHFVVYRKFDGAEAIIINERYTSLIFTDIGLSMGTTYRQYAVKAVNRNGEESDLSNWTELLLPISVDTSNINAEHIISNSVVTDTLFGKLMYLGEGTSVIRHAPHEAIGEIGEIELKRYWNQLKNLLDDPTIPEPSYEFSSYMDYYLTVADYFKDMCNVLGYDYYIPETEEGNIDGLHFEPGSEHESTRLYIRGSAVINIGDIVYMNRSPNFEYWGEVFNVGSNTSGDYIDVYHMGGEIYDIHPGQGIVVFAKNSSTVTLDGIKRSIAVTVNGDSPWDDRKDIVRIGNLHGWDSIEENKQGIAIGSYSSAYFVYDHNTKKFSCRLGNLDNGIFLENDVLSLYGDVYVNYGQIGGFEVTEAGFMSDGIKIKSDGHVIEIGYTNNIIGLAAVNNKQDIIMWVGQPYETRSASNFLIDGEGYVRAVGEFIGSINANGRFDGELVDATGTFNGEFSGVLVDATGNLNGKFTGDLQAQGEFSGEIDADGLFHGEVANSFVNLASERTTVNIGELNFTEPEPGELEVEVEPHVGKINIKICKHIVDEFEISYKSFYLKVMWMGNIIELGGLIHFTNGWENLWQNIYSENLTIVGNNIIGAGTFDDRFIVEFYRGNDDHYYLSLGQSDTEWGYGDISILMGNGILGDILLGDVEGILMHTLNNGL